MLRNDIKKIYEKAIQDSLPNEAVKNALAHFKKPCGRVVLIAIGKAGWQMAKTVMDELKNDIDCGIVITKYNHSLGKIDGLEIYEAGHPIPDENSVYATERAFELTKNLTKDDTVLLLVSGGGSSLFEVPRCSLKELKTTTKELILSGADIKEINTVRKHISRVKGGQLASHVFPASVFSIILSDVIDNDLGVIASGPVSYDATTKEDALKIAEKYNLSIDEGCFAETPKKIDNVVSHITGSVKELCLSAKRTAEMLGYRAEIVTDSLDIEAHEAGKMLAQLAIRHRASEIPLAFIFGGETVVQVKGNGKGGRNQELALYGAKEMQGIDNAAILSIGSDGTDGPTDSAGAWVDGDTWQMLEKLNKSPDTCLKNNDSYNAFKDTEYHIITGPTGTNVNDLMLVLINNK